MGLLSWPYPASGFPCSRASNSLFSAAGKEPYNSQISGDFEPCGGRFAPSPEAVLGKFPCIFPVNAVQVEETGFARLPRQPKPSQATEPKWESPQAGVRVRAHRGGAGHAGSGRFPDAGAVRPSGAVQREPLPQAALVEDRFEPRRCRQHPAIPTTGGDDPQSQGQAFGRAPARQGEGGRHGVIEQRREDRMGAWRCRGSSDQLRCCSGIGPCRRIPVCSSYP